ncbi:MAG TPA: protein kinase [Kofleriaceae bacterium]
MKTMVSTAGGQMAPLPIPDALPVGAKAGPWVVERELGRGGMGAVYAVVHEEIGKRAALKVVHGRLLTPSFNPERMLLEAKVVNQVGHPNIVDIFETGKLADGRPYIVMERLEGQPLAYRADEGKILPDLVIRILLQVCDALIAAHAAGIIHRDLKLDNVFLVDNPDEPATPRVKLLDWGIAKVIHHEVRHTIEGQLVGTPQYLAPEQARGAAVSPATDVYSLGVMAYELFLEQLPFEAETAAEIMAMHLRATPPAPSEMWPDIPPALESLILAMLAKSPDDRPSTLEVARRLEDVATEMTNRRRTVIELPDPPMLPASPRLTRLRSQAGLAPTEHASISGEWTPPRKRWQYVIGGAALAASTVMFLMSRGGDTASASTVPSPKLVPAAIATHEPPAPAPTSAVTPPNIVNQMDPTPVIERPGPRAKTLRTSSSRKAPVAPRRQAKIDPDGTLEPYR